MEQMAQIIFKFQECFLSCPRTHHEQAATCIRRLVSCDYNHTVEMCAETAVPELYNRLPSSDEASFYFFNLLEGIFDGIDIYFLWCLRFTF